MQCRNHYWALLGIALLLIGLASSTALADEWADAIRTNDLDTIKALYITQTDIDRPNEHGKTALMAAAAAGDAQLVDALIARGADPAATNHLGGAVLMYAVGSGSRSIVERLLSADIPVDAQASNGWTAMMMAAAKDQGALITLLDEASANPNTPDIYGWTPLMRAAYENNQSAVAALLSLATLEVDQLNRNEQNALHLAVIAGHTEMVETLLEKDLKQTVDVNQHSPQSIARELGRDDLLSLLTEQESAQ